MSPTYHLFLPQMRMSHDAIVQRALAAEESGFEGIAFMDHLAPPLAAGQDMWEAMSIAGWVLARTSTLAVGHLVLCDALRHPAVLARQATSLDHASGGRFELGLGSGSVPAELSTFGIGTLGPGERIRRLGESLEIIRALWTGEPVDHEGRHFTLVGAQQRPVPTRCIPIVVGGVGERTVELVNSHADWWNVPVQALDRLDALRERVGPAGVSVQLMIGIVRSERDRADLAEVVERRFGGTAMSSNIVLGTAPELAEYFARRHAQGVERFYVWFADFAPVQTLQLFAEVIRASQTR